VYQGGWCFDCGRPLAHDLNAKPHVHRARHRVPRIAIVDYDLLEWFRLLIQGLLKEATLLEFQTAEAAWREILEAPPDLLILAMPQPGLDLLELLAQWKVKYPILATSGFFGEKEALARAAPHLKVSFIQKPFTIKDFRAALENTLKIKIP
jgi:DNA-binding response OmpR family regulator